MKKIRKKLGFLKDLQNKDRTISIGIIGAVPGSGATTMSVAMANYLSGITGKKIAVYEHNGNRTFMKMTDYLNEKDIIEHNGCVYYPKGTTSLASIYNKEYDVVIVDFGSEKLAISEFARCTYRIVMGSLEPWNYYMYEQFYHMAEEIGGSDTWLWILNGDEKNIKRCRKNTKDHIKKRPFIDNPFLIDKSLIEFFEVLF